MLSYEVEVGDRIITKNTKKGVISGQVISKGPVRCSVVDANGKDWGVPYEIIVARTPGEKLTFPKAVLGDIILDHKGDTFKVKRVNQNRYTATRTSDGKDWYVPFHHVVEILDDKKVQREAQVAFLRKKGFSEKDISEFETIFHS